MTTLREAAKAVLAVLDSLALHTPDYLSSPDMEAATVLRQAIAQPESEPEGTQNVSTPASGERGELVAALSVGWEMQNTNHGTLKDYTNELARLDMLMKEAADMLEAEAQPDYVPLSDAEIEAIREKTFSINNPYCPVDSKSMRKAARAIEQAVRGKI
jgi:hypothetical protein